MVVTVLGQNRLDPKRAATMLYALQIAAANARNLTHNETAVVRDIIHDDSGNLLSPDEDPEEISDMLNFLDEGDEQVEPEEEDD